MPYTRASASSSVTLQFLLATTAPWHASPDFRPVHVIIAMKRSRAEAGLSREADDGDESSAINSAESAVRRALRLLPATRRLNGGITGVDSAVWRSAASKLETHAKSAEASSVRALLQALEETSVDAGITTFEWSDLKKRTESALATRDGSVVDLTCDISASGSGADGTGDDEIVITSVHSVQSEPKIVETDAYKCESIDLTGEERSSGTERLSVQPSPFSPRSSSTTLGIAEHAFQLMDVPGASGEGVCISQIVLPGAELAVVHAFAIDLEWLWESCPSLQTSSRVLIIHGSRNAAEEEMLWRQYLRKEGAENRVRFARPWTPAYGTVHSKMFLLFYEGGCRVCIHTANLAHTDWNGLTQAAWIRDFPKREQSMGSVRARDEFRDDLVEYFLYALPGQQGAEVRARLLEHNFREAGCAIVASVPGTHSGLKKNRFGHARLRALLKREVAGRDVQRECNAICQFSSLGSIHKNWIDDEFRSTLFADREQVPISTNDNMQLVYPTEQCVMNATHGFAAAASIPVRRKNLEREHILRKLHTWQALQAGRSGIPPHMKSFLRYAPHKKGVIDWVLLGSFNLSAAAWGRMLGTGKKRSASAAAQDGTWEKISIMSFEVGVLCTPSLYCKERFRLSGQVPRGVGCTERERKKFVLRVEECDDGRMEEEETVVVPLPYKVPPKRYAVNERGWTLEAMEVAMMMQMQR